MFIGNDFAIIEIKYGISTLDFKVLSGETTFLTDIGLGISPGLGSILAINGITIFENEVPIYQNAHRHDMMNDNNRICNEISLNNAIPLITGCDYKIAFQYTGSYFYSIVGSSKNISNSKINLKLPPSITSLAFYLRLL